MNGHDFALAIDAWIDELPTAEKSVASKLHKEHLEKIHSGVTPDEAMNAQWNDWYQRFKKENNIVFHGNAKNN